MNWYKKVESTNPVDYSCFQKPSWAIGDKIPINDRDKGESAIETTRDHVHIGILKGINTGGSQTLNCILSR